MKLITRIGQGLFAIGLLTAAAHAVPINGAVAFGGAYEQVGGTQGNLMTATSFNITSTIVTNDSGDFNNATAVGFLNPILNSGLSFAGNPTLWTITAGGNTFSFIVNSWSKVTNTTDTVVFQGTGAADDVGAVYESTAGEWQLSFGSSAFGNNISFSWQGTSAVGGTPTVPEGGVTVALLGFGLAGLALIRRRLVA